MYKSSLVAATAVCVAGSLALAGPAMAAKGDDAAAGGSDTSTWEMPDVKGMILHPALMSILSATGGKHVKVRYIDAGGQPVYNDEFWMVCAQSPAAGSETSKYTVTLKVERPAFDECP